MFGFYKYKARAHSISLLEQTAFPEVNPARVGAWTHTYLFPKASKVTIWAMLLLLRTLLPDRRDWKDTFRSEQFLTLSNLSSFWHFPISAVSDTLILTLSNLDCFWHFPIWAISDTFQFWHFPISTISDTFQFWHFPIQGGSDTFQFWRFPNWADSDTFQFWHFPILTLSNPETFQFCSKWAKYGFWHFPILTLSNFAQNGQKMDSDTFQFWHFPISPRQALVQFQSLKIRRSSDFYVVMWRNFKLTSCESNFKLTSCQKGRSGRSAVKWGQRPLAVKKSWKHLAFLCVEARLLL